MVKRLFPVVLAVVALAVALGVRGSSADSVGPYHLYLPQVATDGASVRTVPSTTPQTGTRTGAVCKDGTTSSVTGSGACSGHGGVAYWLY